MVRWLSLLATFALLVATAAADAPRYKWIDNGGESALYFGTVQVGGYRHADRVYMAFDAASGKWSGPTAAPIDPPGTDNVDESDATPVEANYGVDANRIRHPVGDEPTTFARNGKPITRDDALALFGRPKPGPSPNPSPQPSPAIPDESNMLRVTVIGSPTERAPFVAAYNAPDAADVRSHTILWEVDADHWIVGEYGFVATGRPTVYVQSMDPDGHGGKVLHRQDDYTPGDHSIDAIRRAIKSYNPRADVDLRASDSHFNAEDFAAWFRKNTRMLVGSAAVAGAALYRKVR